MPLTEKQAQVMTCDGCNRSKIVDEKTLEIPRGWMIAYVDTRFINTDPGDSDFEVVVCDRPSCVKKAFGNVVEFPVTETDQADEPDEPAVDEAADGEAPEA